MEAAATRIDYDTTPIRSAAVRQSVDLALDNLSLRKRRGIWGGLSRQSGRFPQSRTVVVADLHQLSSSGQLDYWSAGPSNMSYVFLVRTASDRKRLRNPEYALRLNDEKFFLFDLACEPSAKVAFSASLAEYFRTLVDRLEPDRVRSARFAPADELLWVEFSDGLERGVKWKELPFTAHLDFVPVSASASDHGQSVLFLNDEGREIDVDAGALRAVIDPAHRTEIESQDELERASIGRRLRQLRDEQGLSQEELSARTGIPQESLSRLENGRRDPRLETLRKLAAGYNLELADVLARLGTA